MTTQGPVFVMSSERSGSNLLRTLLSNHSGIAGPPAIQILASFLESAGLYGDLSSDPSRLQLAGDLIAVANHPQFSWGLEATPEELAGRVESPTFLGFFDALYRTQCERKGARRYACKENRLFDFAGELLEAFPDSRFLYLVRDPRDYVCSWMNVPLLNNTPFRSASCWTREQRACLEVERLHPDRVHRVYYEGLIQDTEATMTEVLTFLGEEVEPACFEVEGRKNEGMTWSCFWTNLSKPVIRGNSAKYRKVLKPRVLEMVETVACEEMEALGYAPETSHAWRRGPLFKLREQRLERSNDSRLRREHAATVAVIEDRLDLVRRLHEEARSVLGQA